MRIGLDLRMVGGGSGIDRYITELAMQILQIDKKNEYILFVRNAEQAKDFKKFDQRVVIADIPHYSLAEQMKFPSVLKKENLDIVHFPHFNVPIFYNRPFVVTIHDLIHTKIPGRKKSHFIYRIAYNLIIRHAIRTSKKIIAVSTTTKKEILEHFKVAEKKIQVVYEGAKDTYHMIDKLEAKNYVREKFKITKPYVLYVGVWRRYKNLPNLSKAFTKLKKQGLNHELVLVGEPDPHYPEIMEQVTRNMAQKSIKTLGRVSDEDLLNLYNAADLFVLPSLSEGFGLTPLEAGACGVAVACSDIPTLREVMGSGAEYFDPLNIDNIADVIKSMLNDDKLREELANRALARTKHFSWKQAAEETVSIYNKSNKSDGDNNT
jgi:glycosyltransferase involved in cell wall biosynthesis